MELKMKNILCILIMSLITASAWADFKEAKTYVDQGNNAQALSELKSCATKNRKCELMLWVINKASQDKKDGKTIDTRNYVIKSLAQKGEPDFQYQLASLYEEGEYGEQKDTKKALLWYTRAATQNYGPAEFALGRIYWFGEIVPKDLKKSYYHTQRSANLVDEQFNEGPSLLGLMYQTGMGTKENKLLAYRWFSIGALYGSQNSEKFKQLAALELTKSQMDKVDKEVKTWIAQHEKDLARKKNLSLD